MGLFNSLRLPVLPIPWQPFTFFMSMTEGRGIYMTTLRFIYMEANLEVYNDKFEVELTDPVETAMITRQEPPLHFFSTGTYVMEVTIGGELVNMSRLRVRLHGSDTEIGQPPHAQVIRGRKD